MPGSVSGAGGLPSASVVPVGAVLLLLLFMVSGCSLMFLFGCTRGCWVPCVLLCFRCARQVFLVLAGCLGPCSCAPVLVLLVRARGLALRLGVCLLGFPAVVCAVTPVPPIASFGNVRSTRDVAPVEYLRITSVLYLLRSVPALRCLGAQGLPRRLGFSCVCAERVPVALAVGAVLPYRCLGGTGCGVLVRYMYSVLVGGLLFAALACVGGLGSLCVCAFGKWLQRDAVVGHVPSVVSCSSF